MGEIRKRVTLVIHDGKGKVLVGRHRKAPKGTKSTAFPGGGVEKGQSVAKASVQEALEEVGVRIKDPITVGIAPKNVPLPNGGKDYKDGRFSHIRQYWRAARYAGKSEKLLGTEGDALKSRRFIPVEKAIETLEEMAADPKNDNPDWSKQQAEALQIVRKHVDKTASTDPLKLIQQFGPPSQWSGASASAMGPENRRTILRAWRSLSSEERKTLTQKFKESFDRRMSKRAAAATLGSGVLMALEKPRLARMYEGLRSEKVFRALKTTIPGTKGIHLPGMNMEKATRLSSLLAHPETAAQIALPGSPLHMPIAELVKRRLPALPKHAGVIGDANKARKLVDLLPQQQRDAVERGVDAVVPHAVKDPVRLLKKGVDDTKGVVLEQADFIKKHAVVRRLSKEKRQAYSRAGALHRSDEPEKWDAFLQHAERKSYAQAIAKNPRSDQKLILHTDRMNRLLTGKTVGTVKGSTGEYGIIRLRGGGLGCRCNDWRFRGSVADKGDTDCKHIKEFKKSRRTRSKIAMAVSGDDAEALQKGDIILTTMGKPTYLGKPGASFVSKTKERVYRSVSPKLQGGYTHSAIYTGNGEIVEARADGVQRRTLKKGLAEIDGAIVVRPRAPKRTRGRAADFALSRVGRPYESEAFLGGQGVALVLPRKAEKLLARKDSIEEAKRFTCGNLTAAAYLSQGFTPRSKREWSMAVPGDFLNPKKSRLVRVLGEEREEEPVIGRMKGTHHRHLKAADAPSSPRLKSTLQEHQKNASALPVVKKRETWQMEVQEQGAGVRLQLKAPSGQALSWGIQGGMPLVGGSVAAVEGGSAAGKSLLKTDVEVFHAGSGKLKFNHYKGSNHDEYVLKRKGTGWQLRNATAHKGTMPAMPKPKYKEKKQEGLLDPSDNAHVWGPKVDGSHNVFHLRKGQAIRAFSHRSSKRNRSGLLEHSHKVPGLMDKKVPDHLDGTVIRAEIFARSQATGRPLSAESVAGMLNSGVRKSRAAQAAQGLLEVSTFDVARYRGVDMSTAPYKEKLRVLHEVQKEYPLLKPTPVAMTKTEKLKLLEDIKGGTHPLTDEGIVEWNLHKGVKPVKWKIKPDMDLEIVGTFETKGGKYSGTHVGGLLVKDEKGVVSRVGTGFGDKFRRLAYEHPGLIKGRVARITSMGAYPSGKLRVPSFQGLHTEKNDPTELAAIEAEMSKYAAIHILTGGTGAGKSTRAKKLKDQYDLVLGTDLGGVRNGQYVMPPQEDRGRLRAERQRQVLDAHAAGQRVLLEGYPSGVVKYPEAIRQAEKLEVLKVALPKRLWRIAKRSRERGTPVLPDLKMGVETWNKDRKTLPKVHRLFEEKTAAKEWTPHGIHRRLGAFKVPREAWDDNPEFMAWTKRIVGKEHLDDMSPEELKRIAIAISRKYKPRKPGPKKKLKFAKKPVIDITAQDRADINARIREAGKQPGCVSLKHVDAGYAVHTHRARTKFYPTVKAIPLAKIRFIASTG
jgi:8-oxo-dGTP pyrophosphatase MutT (NUDIX family)